MTKVIAINGSPRLEKGNTALLLNAFVEGLQVAGAEVEVVYASRLKVKPCACGDMYCWYKKPGECCFKDDMQDLYPRLREAGILVLATPIYIPLPGDMQNVINRLCPLVQPYLENRDGRTRARFHKNVAIRKFVLVSTGGWWELGNFGTVERIVAELAADASAEFAGSVLRPHAAVMKKDGELTPDGLAVLAAARQAGTELVRDGAMKVETLEAIRRALVPEEDLRRRYNRMFE